MNFPHAANIPFAGERRDDVVGGGALFVGVGQLLEQGGS